MKVDFLEIDRDKIKNNCFIVKLGSKDRPATEEDINDFEAALSKLFDLMELDFKPNILITHHEVSFETISREQIADLVNSCLK